jgi:glutamyl-tRNA synthetase
MSSEKSQVRVRFAPSPTGHLHVGGARTALFNWLFARHAGGTFILRIEDTDLQRSTKESIDAIIDNIRWLGLDWDEGPILQSSRFHLYAPYAERLVSEGKAYVSEEKKGIKPAIILKQPESPIIVNDLIHGEVKFSPETVGDLVLMKSDGTPTYNFACVIDDADMGITHIIRGDDHLSNTPKQLILYEALGLPVPLFAHVPLILGPDGTRLSKRHGATAVGQFRDEGILPDALVNFLALLGWSPGDDREIMSLDELIAAFSLDRVSKKSAVFDTKKLEWLNMQYFKRRSAAEIARMSLPYLKEFGVSPDSVDLARLEEVVKLLGERFRTLRDLADKAHYFFTDAPKIDPAAFRKHVQKENAAAILEEVAARLEPLREFDKDTIEREIRAVIAARGVKPGEVIQPVRVAISGRTETPGIFETLALVGKEKALDRMKKAPHVTVVGPNE